ncbi:hypothetical protein DACRYDRAFT_14186 [Dacryopinax primogenitus]|uniref:Uncharacterized protein n=1 Tax=Dacryopinax primogenitus (strain DJM 731) TaxID=1858805 RepID=M5G4D7_DACPD|nr:uncharacterized protein DACRYDRAFT_14186 [Dacryopinax primogenitus]EJU05126.1 hypothetical protein DACRYDRAFT_14186 [Dacryopinax primogenitus]
MHRAISQAARRPLAAASLRTFTSSTTPWAPSPTSPLQEPIASFHNIYAKDDHTYEPVPAGTTHYVVSQPEHKNTPYDVPAGAFPTSSPYDLYASTQKPQFSGQPSSTSSTAAHPNTTNRVPRVEDTYPYGSSSAVRHNDAPGEMAKGSGKGVHLSEGVRVTPGTGGELASRNGWPSEEQGKAGLDEAGKMRK